MLETQPIPLEQLKAQRDKAWEECCRLDWLICKEQNRLSDACRKQRDAWLDNFEAQKGPRGGGGSCGGNGRDGVMLFTIGGLPKTYTG